MVALARTPDARVRDLAIIVGITERAVQQILGDLEAGGVIARKRLGRRNTYTIDTSVPLRHPNESDHTVADILAIARA